MIEEDPVDQFWVVRHRMFPLLVERHITSDKMLNMTRTTELSEDPYYSPLLAGLYFTFLMVVVMLSVMATERRQVPDLARSSSPPPSYLSVVFAEEPPEYDEVVNDPEKGDLIIL